MSRALEEWTVVTRRLESGFVAFCYRDGERLQSKAYTSAREAQDERWRLVESFDRARKTVELPAVVLP